MQASGGVATAQEAAHKPLFTIGSGPVGGVIGSQFLAETLGHTNVIASDVGGTSFDVGIIHESRPLTSSETIIHQYTFFMPQLVALDLRAEIAGCKVARERLLALIGRYGAETIKGVMRKLQDDSEKAFVQRLETIPDGTWSESSWIELKDPNDRHLYRNMLFLTKRENTLTFSNTGSDPQAGTLNCTMVAWKGAIASMICSQMLFDQMFVVEGAYRHLEFDVTPGTITCATYPAAVSAAPALTLLQTIALAGLVISKMLACSSDEDMRSEVQSCMGAAMYPVLAFSGVDQRGAPYASFLPDPVGGCVGRLSVAGWCRYWRLAVGLAKHDAQC